MGAKNTFRAVRVLSTAALIFVMAVNGRSQTVSHDSFENSNFSAIWNQTQGVTIHNASGANATPGFASLNPGGGKLGGTLATFNQSPHGLSDFSIEFFFRIQNAAKGQFALQLDGTKVSAASLSNPLFQLSYTAQKGWVFSSGSNGVTAWNPVTGTKPIVPDAWYRLRFIGRDWNGTNAHFALQLSEPNKNTFATSATGSIHFEAANPNNEPAGHFALVNTADDNSAFDVDEINVAAITPYQGPVVKDVDTKTLSGKVMCGYQGWFGAPGDGSPEHGWRHWTKNHGPLEDGNAKVDLWPDVSELDPNQRFRTGFTMANGSPAEVFSSFQKPTVLKHFQWMQDYGIDGVFVQRFANGVRNPPSLEHCNTVLANCREGANLHGRAYAVMYDLSGLPAGHIDDVINDWRALRNEMVITEDPAYLNHRGKPVVAVWGIGFNDHRDYTLAECRRLIEFLKNDPEVGGCTVMLGVPTNWRELKGDAVSDPALLDILAMADIISPWTVGRYSNPAGAANYTENTLKPDLAWCSQRGIDFLPVIFPGFSWHNMKGGPSNQIPRSHGEFLWSQFLNVKQANVNMTYVAMFDEVDEGTAIFKVTSSPPTQAHFVGYDGLPSDWYLRLVGEGTKMLRGERPLSTVIPIKP